MYFLSIVLIVFPIFKIMDWIYSDNLMIMYIQIYTNNTFFKPLEVFFFIKASSILCVH
jgi:hypothetical protein